MPKGTSCLRVEMPRGGSGGESAGRPKQSVVETSSLVMSLSEWGWEEESSCGEREKASQLFMDAMEGK